jgi:ParB-like chromosome segregation protein Spo0J
MRVMRRSVLDDCFAHAEYRGVRLGKLAVMDLRDSDSFMSLLESVSECGMREPIELSVTSAGEVSIRNGHHRYVAARLLGWSSVPIIVRSYE